MNSAVNKVFVRLLLAAAVLTILSIIAFAIWRVQLAIDIKRQLAAIRAVGLPANGEEANAYYPTVADEENAALKMAEAFALMTNYNDSRSIEVNRKRFPSRKEVWSSEQLELFAGYCAMNSNALARTGEAIQLPRSRYPIDLSQGAATLLPHLAELKRLSLVAEYHSLLVAKSSAEDISTILGLARTLETEPVLISKLVRIALLNIAAQALEHRLNTDSLTDAELERLSKLLVESAKTNQIANGLIGERAMMIRYFRMSYAEATKLADADDGISPQKGGPPLPGPQPSIFRFTGFFERDLRFYLQSMETNISLVEEDPIQLPHIEMVQARISHASRHNIYILSSMLLPAFGSSGAKEANSLGKVRTAQTALAVERFRLANGKLPEKLSELVPQFLSVVPDDPFDGRPLRFHRLEKGYVVYSIGSDGQDNGGRERPANAKSNDTTPYDITFTVER